MNSNINGVTQSIGEKERTVTANLDEIRELLKQLKQTENNINTNTTIQNEDTQQNGNSDNLPPSDENFVYDENYNSPFNNLEYDSDADSDADAGFAHTTNVPPLKLTNQFDYKMNYTPTQIQNFYHVANKTATGEEMKLEEKYDIIVNAEKRHDYLKKKKNKTSDEQEEFQKLDEIYQDCHEEPDKHCIKIKNMWKDYESRRNYRSNIPQSGNQVQAWSTPTATPTATPRLSPEQLIEKADKDIIKTRYNFLLAHPDEKKIHLDEFNNLKNKVGSFVKNEVQSIDGRPNNKVVLPPLTNTRKNRGGKRRSTMKRGKQNKKSQKKSKSHKKRH
jgi:hypothetical protein